MEKSLMTTRQRSSLTYDNNVQEFLNFERCAIYEIFMNPEQDLVPKVKGIMTESGFLSPPLEEMSPLLTLENIQKCMTKINKISYEIRL